MSPPLSERPPIDCEMVSPGLLVPDVPEAAAFYMERLGFSPGYVWGDPPTSAGVTFGKVMLQLSTGTPNPAGGWVSFQVTGVDELYEYHRANGVKVLGPPEDKPWRIRQYHVEDLNGYTLEFGQFLFDREPPLEIERVDVPVRLEKRLAAVLADIAKRKRMTVDECLEETLLHTFERLDTGGVASPHTLGDLAYIQKLKARHGIDYDCHASYRFKERPQEGTGGPKKT
jgi:catechol 2,3-dioxygenase-like lactoylglutathione lyase family enzyme